MNYMTRSWAEIDLNALKNNILNIKKITDSKIIAVVKADAYGHGAEACAKVLLENGADMLAVACIDEARLLRRKFSDVDILILGSSNVSAFNDIVKYNITASVCSLEEAINLNETAEKYGKTAKIHIKIDSGMGRLGFQITKANFENTVEQIKKIKALHNIEIEGVFTHFSCADEDYNYTKLQFDRFLSFCDTLRSEGISIKIRHCSNSASLILYPEFHLDAVRPGIVLYGYHPSDATKGMIELFPVMSIKSRITHVKELERGSFISYGNEYCTSKTEKIATVPIGYADGFLRGNLNKAHFIHKGKLLPVVGRICMDQCMINATDVNNINVGDIVTVIGSENQISVTADDIAENLGTINYEIICIISKRLPRIYIKDNEIVECLAVQE